MIDLHFTLEEAEDVKSAVMSHLLHLDNSIRRVEAESPEWTKWLEVRRADRDRAANEFLLINNAIENWKKEFGPETYVEEIAAVQPINLERFKEAQAQHLFNVEHELVFGEKRTHWIWFIFPQPPHPQAQSETSKYYALSDEEAYAYYADETLRFRLHLHTDLVIMWLESGRPLSAILSPPDDLKFRSSMELFERVSGGAERFTRALRLSD